MTYASRDRQLLTMGSHTLQIWYCRECGAVYDVELIGCPAQHSEPIPPGVTLISPRELHEKWHETMNKLVAKANGVSLDETR